MSQVAHLTPAESLLSHWYAWEREGRGWQLYDAAIRPEPLFTPFMGHFVHTAPPRDDGRHHTLRSWITEGIAGLFSPKPQLAQRVPPRLFAPREAPEQTWVDLRIQVPADTKVEIEEFEQLLVSLASCRKPACFEVIGRGPHVLTRLSVDEEDADSARSFLEAYVPDAVISGEGLEPLPHSYMDTTEVVEFGLGREFMLPLATYRDLDGDPYVALIAALAALRSDELAVLQVLFEPVTHAWSASALRSVTLSDGSAFFDDAPGFLPQVKRKLSRPLFAAVVRIAAATASQERTVRILRSLAGALGHLANPEGNDLIPLANPDNDEYGAIEHASDLFRRQCRRSGCILSSEELATLVHLPTAQVQNAKLERLSQITKAAPASVRGHSLVLGVNIHNGNETLVTLSADQRVRHTHVVGASGTGKSTFLLNLILQDIEAGQGIGVIDPHGDLIDEILGRIPEKRVKDVVLVDPSDEEYPIGFNILSAHSDLEKNLLASDLVAVFKRFSESWGDQMGSVLSNAVLAFLESTRGGTLADLRRFLIEKPFRTEFLSSVTDDHVLYYWSREFPLLSGRPQAPLLTRLDTFLRPKPIRYMVSQRENRLDFASMMDTGKIFLAKLAQGAIGEENASLLGSLFVSKFHQLALGRQSQSESSRRYFWLYCDEFGGYVTPSMAKLLSGARKFRLGLTLSHQELQQIHDPDVKSALISNAGTRICFRLGDDDATQLAPGFSFFDAANLRNLTTGQAICKVGRAEDDCNLTTYLAEPPDEATAILRRKAISTYTRQTYATKREEMEAMMRPAEEVPAKPVAPQKAETLTEEQKSGVVEEVEKEEQVVVPPVVAVPPVKVKKPRAVGKTAPMGKGGARHKYLQQLVAQCGQQQGWKATLEMPTGSGAESIDVVLERESRRLAFEISVTTSVDMELGNLRKCLTAGFGEVFAVCDTAKTLAGLQKAVSQAFTAEELAKVRILDPEELFADLQILAAGAMPEEQVVAGYKVRVKRAVAADAETEARRRVIAGVLGRGNLK